MSSATSRAGIRTPVVHDRQPQGEVATSGTAVKPAVPGAVVTEDGRVFRGTGFGAVGTALGEGVFATGMTGYQETLTDPSYHRQIVVMTAPHVGNTGMVGEDAESSRIWVAGFVVRELSLVASNWRAERTLSDELASAGVVGVAGVDTRALTRHLRSAGAMRMGLFTGPDAEADEKVLVERVRQAPEMLGANLTGDVSAVEPYVVPAIGDQVARVVAVDLGIKAMTPHRLAERGCEVTVVPASISPEELLGLGADGIFFSNGPGDPATAEHAVELMRAALASGTPVFGICFGNQILGRALGFGTYKLRFGHRGINQPVLDRRTGKVEITAHNHGFAVDADPEVVAETEFGRVEVSHVCLNDGVVEGLRCLDRPAFSVQYHPEAAAGPHDADYLFDEFVEAMTRIGDQAKGGR